MPPNEGVDEPSQPHDDREEDAEFAAEVEQRFRRMHLISQAFRPSAPVDRRELFAGRVAQISELLDVLNQTGQHGVIYGERGVGKTSLTAVIREFMGGGLAPRANCVSTDTFDSIWRKVLGEIQVTQSMPTVGFRPGLEAAVVTASELFDEDPVTPDDVKRALQVLGSTARTAVFIDEFDQVEDARTRNLFADTVKLLSDQLVPATVILVGVADNVDDLIAEHRSIERSLVQILMPRMTTDELAVIVKRGVDAAEMSIEASAVSRITRLSQGLPHYTHLLAQLAARAALDRSEFEVRVDDVDLATSKAIGKAQRSIAESYHRATLSTRANLYPQVLLACALTEGDDLGYFAASDVREPLSTIMKRRYDIPAFARHLSALSESGRGPVLQKKGSQWRLRYRFVNPLLQPFVIMKGLSDQLISHAVVERFTAS